MNIYQLKRDRPDWVNEPATNRQVKVLKFFGLPIDEVLTKGLASSLVGQVFSDSGKRELWEKYVYVTGDCGSESADLKSFDVELDKITIPDDWWPLPEPRKPTYKKHLQLAIDLLSEGSPFDTPVPEITLQNSYFAFTGTFVAGNRKSCMETTQQYGGHAQKGLNFDTDYLVVGDEGSNSWSHSKGGDKIQKAIIYRMEYGKPAIITEGDWVGAMQDQDKE